MAAGGAAPTWPVVIDGRKLDRAGAVEAQEAGAEPKPQRDVEIAPALGGVRLALEPAGVGVLFG